MGWGCEVWTPLEGGKAGPERVGPGVPLPALDSLKAPQARHSEPRLGSRFPGSTWAGGVPVSPSKASRHQAPGQPWPPRSRDPPLPPEDAGRVPRRNGLPSRIRLGSGLGAQAWPSGLSLTCLGRWWGDAPPPRPPKDEAKSLHFLGPNTTVAQSGCLPAQPSQADVPHPPFAPGERLPRGPAWQLSGHTCGSHAHLGSLPLEPRRPGRGCVRAAWGQGLT